MNNVVLIGRLTRDPELRYLPGSGRPVANFTLAVDKGLSKSKREEFESQGKPTADFIRITVWGNSAEHVAKYTEKGRLVAVQGRIATDSYEDENGKRIYTTDIVAYQVKFLEWGDRAANSNKNETNSMDGFRPVDNSDIPF